LNDLASSELLSDAIAVKESREVLHGEQDIQVAVTATYLLYVAVTYCTCHKHVSK